MIFNFIPYVYRYIKLSIDILFETLIKQQLPYITQILTLPHVNIIYFT